MFTAQILGRNPGEFSRCEERAHVRDHQKRLEPPHPYCPDDVLVPIQQREAEYQTLEQVPSTPLVIALQEQTQWEQLLADENLGG